MQGTVDDLDEAWKMFVWIEAFQYRHLPDGGGLSDQDEMLMDNIMRIKSVVQRTKKT